MVLLDDVRHVLASADGMHLTDLVSGLALRRPALYGSLEPRSLGSQLRTAGVTVENVHVSGKPRETAGGQGRQARRARRLPTTLVGNDDPGDNVIPLLTGRQKPPDKPEASR